MCSIASLSLFVEICQGLQHRISRILREFINVRWVQVLGTYRRQNCVETSQQNSRMGRKVEWNNKPLTFIPPLTNFLSLTFNT